MTDRVENQVTYTRSVSESICKVTAEWSKLQDSQLHLYLSSGRATDHVRNEEVLLKSQ